MILFNRSFLNIPSVDTLLDRQHPGGFGISSDEWYPCNFSSSFVCRHRFEKGGDLCSFYEYPSNEQVYYWIKMDIILLG